MAASTPIDASFHKLLRSIQAQAPAATRLAASTPGCAGHLSGSCPAAAGELPGCCPSSPRQLPVSYRAASGKLGSCRARPRQVPGMSPATAGQLSGSCPAIAGPCQLVSRVVCWCRHQSCKARRPFPNDGKDCNWLPEHIFDAFPVGFGLKRKFRTVIYVGFLCASLGFQCLPMGFFASGAWASFFVCFASGNLACLN